MDKICDTCRDEKKLPTYGRCKACRVLDNGDLSHWTPKESPDGKLVEIDQFNRAEIDPFTEHNQKLHETKSERAVSEVRRIHMTINQKETIQRALGIVEGIAYGVDEKAADALVTAVAMIDGVLHDAGADDRG